MSDLISLIEIQQNRKFLQSFDVQSLKNQHKEVIIKKKIQKLSSSAIYIVSRSIKYLDQSSDYLNLLLVSKQWYNNLKRLVVKQFLHQQAATLNNQMINKQYFIDIRRQIWCNIVQLQSVTLDINKLREDIKVKMQDEKIFVDNKKFKDIAELIQLDVIRSFTGDSKSLMDQGKLGQLLQMYAVYNPNINYCQGMNFLMGFLYIVLKDDTQAFKFFVEIIDLLLKDIMTEDLHRIKVLFYQLDRLLQIKLPDLAEHLKKLKIEAGHYASPWFLTLFTSYYSPKGYPKITYDIWDIILQQRWKGMFKVLVSIFQYYEQILLKMNFDQLLSFLNNMLKSEFFTNKENIQQICQKESHFPKSLLESVKPIDNIKELSHNIKIQASLLNALEKEHDVLSERIKSVIKQQTEKNSIKK